MLQTQEPVIFSVIVFIFMRFRPFHAYTICLRFRFDPLSRAFSKRQVLDENAQHIGEDGRPKRVERYAFSNESAFVWIGPKIIDRDIYYYSFFV